MEWRFNDAARRLLARQEEGNRQRGDGAHRVRGSVPAARLLRHPG
ncbi:MAG: hypothetical protein WKG07_42935 [Hymenobacter sp.]